MKGDGQIKTGIAVRPKIMPSNPSMSRKCCLLSKHNKYTRFITKNLPKSIVFALFTKHVRMERRGDHYYYYFRYFDFTLKSLTFGVPGLVLLGRGTAWDKSGTSREIRDGWQPYKQRKLSLGISSVVFHRHRSRSNGRPVAYIQLMRSTVLCRHVVDVVMSFAHQIM